MAVTLKYVAQAAMDDYFQNYRGNANFFDLEDFILRAGSVIADFYQKTYQQKYVELKADKRAAIDLVAFDQGMLAMQELDVKYDKDEGEFVSTLTQPVMTFLYDQSGVGYQLLLPVNPKSTKLERTSLNELWQVQYVPFVDRVFWMPENGKIKYIKKGNCNINKVKLFYIPALQNQDGEYIGDAQVPDGIVNMTITGTAMLMKQVAEGTVVKQTNDLNPNKIIQSEINKEAVK